MTLSIADEQNLTQQAAATAVDWLVLGQCAVIVLVVVVAALMAWKIANYIMTVVLKSNN